MPDIAFADIGPTERYELITGAVWPRPIAFVTSLGPGGRVNAAPFSAFNYMGEDPPILALGVERYRADSTRPGEEKDTLVNIRASGAFVINMVDAALMERMIGAGADYPADVSETDALGLDVTPWSAVGVPRLTEAPVAFACRLFALHPLGRIRTMVLGEVTAIHVRDGLMEAGRPRIDVDRYRPVGRLGGLGYAVGYDVAERRTPRYAGG